jgi:threonine synthase
LKFISTRGEAPALSFEGALLAALAPDGGLFMPEAWPRLAPDEFAALAGLDSADAACRIMSPFLAGDPCAGDLEAVVQEAYDGFHHPAIAPLRQIGPNAFVLELFHGPTLAFKDLAMQVVSRFMNRALLRKGGHATVVGATSGDTGAAGIEAFRGLDAIDVFILHPKGRNSDVQRRQMTTATEANVHNIAVEGTFDDCQAIVKGLFNHHAFRDRVRLSGVNSINWARIVAQVVYYFTAAAALGSPHRKVAFTVPTGNFGDVFAAYVAGRMGLPVDRLVVATNVNDILARTLATGTYELREVVATSSPSMDIQVSSNFERLLFDACGRDSAPVRALMASLAQSRSFSLASSALSAIRARFSADRADEQETAAAIRTTLRETGRLVDPHTAVGIAVAEKEARDPAVPMIVLATAHPAKFPDAVVAACGVRPALPEWLADLPARHERATRMPADQGAVEQFILAASRAAHEGAAA